MYTQNDDPNFFLEIVVQRKKPGWGAIGEAKGTEPPHEAESRGRGFEALGGVGPLTLNTVTEHYQRFRRKIKKITYHFGLYQTDRFLDLMLSILDCSLFKSLCAHPSCHFFCETSGEFLGEFGGPLFGPWPWQDPGSILGRRGLCHCWGLHELLGWVGRLGLSTHVGVHSLVTSVTSVANFFTDTELPQYLFEATLVSNFMFPNLLRPFF